ncbi:MAG: tRNA (adenosine(37)-N6)-threonylcarbamoyltransferase complex ATPase subunit type 1 TsaE [Chitinophagaceae bacterium]|nr:tRNA (adenosine(37)-N6)-threonylcarbamoyltransferase complex ATPase subunit type 1 TsaE [Chitinophagaceae bacterium]
MERLFTKSELDDVARWCWEQAAGARVIALHGSMGAGKTTLVHAMCMQKGVKDAVSSPTFSLINEYYYEESGQTRKIYHIDLYRLKDEEEAIRAGVEDCFYSDHICLVEWPEKAPGLFPPGTLHFHIDLPGNETRRLVISGN